MFVSWEITVVKMVIFSKLIYRFDEICIKIQAGFYMKVDKLILKFILKFKRSRIARIVMKKNQAGARIFPDFEIHLKVIKTV